MWMTMDECESAQDLSHEVCVYHHKLWKKMRAGSVEDVVGRGVAQVFHDLLVELRLLLVAEVEEGEEDEGQEESWEVESGVQGEEATTWMTMVME